jgi:hypothetical protein
MFIASRLVWGLVCIHLFWFYFYITGTLIRPRQQPAPDLDDPKRTGPSVLTDLVITTATGMAITGFVTFIFGLLGLLNAGAFLLWLIIEGLLFKAVREENIFKADFWVARFKHIKRAFDLPALIIYCVFLIISVPAILPPIAFDAISYHLAYAVDWANAGRIYADEFLRTPYYANNFILLYALMFVLKLGALCHFLTWLCGLLTGLGVYSVIAQEKIGDLNNSNTWTARRASVMALVIALGLGCSPVFLRWVNTGFLDVAIGLFILIPVLSTYIGLQAEARNYQRELIITAGFCVGIKITLVLFLPLFVVSLILLRKRGRPLSRTFVLIGLLLILSAPWYVRNSIKTGDPLSPTLNMMFQRRDPIWSRVDYAGLLADLNTPKNPVSLIRLPFDLYWNTPAKNLREYGTSPAVMLLYVPCIMAILFSFARVRAWFGTPFVYLNLALIYLLAYWIGISSLARYFLHLFPLYLIYLGVWLNTLLRASGVDRSGSRAHYATRALIIVSLVALMLFPSPTSRMFYQELMENNYLQLANRFSSYSGFLRQNLPGYASVQYILANQSNHEETVLLIGFENLGYYFRRNRIMSFGDWFGIGRHSDLIDSINAGDLSSYLAKFNVGAVLVNRSEKRIDDDTYLRFVKQLEETNFALQPAQENGADIYIKAK